MIIQTRENLEDDEYYMHSFWNKYPFHAYPTTNILHYCEHCSHYANTLFYKVMIFILFIITIIISLFTFLVLVFESQKHEIWLDKVGECTWYHSSSKENKSTCHQKSTRSIFFSHTFLNFGLRVFHFQPKDIGKKLTF